MARQYMRSRRVAQVPGFCRTPDAVGCVGRPGPQSRALQRHCMSTNHSAKLMQADQLEMRRETLRPASPLPMPHYLKQAQDSHTARPN